MSTHRSFLLERYFAIHEFKCKYTACASDGQALTIKDILSMNNNDAASRKLVQELWYNMDLAYTESEGSTLLREEICKMYLSMKKPLIKDDVLIITPQEGIYLAMKCLLHDGDHIICVSPSYQSLYENAMSENIEISFWRFRLNADRNWTLNIEELESMIRPSTSMLVINFPHNPTGYMPTTDEFVGILSIAQKHGLIVFSDEMYWWLFDADRHQKGIQSAVMMMDQYPNIVSLSGMSKTFCAPGARIGWLLTRNKGFMQRFQEFKDYLTICASAPSEVLSILTLRNGNYLKVIDRITRIIEENTRNLQQFVKRNGDVFYWTQYREDGHCGGLTKFIGYKLGRIVPVKLFCDRVVEECGVMLLPSPMFEYQDVEGERKQFVRFGLGREYLKEALVVLDSYLKEWRGNGFKMSIRSQL